jgi:hypothetical protein
VRYLIISERGAIVSLAAALEREGHSALVHIVDQRRNHLGLGLANMVRTPRPLRDANGVYNISSIEWLLDTARPDVTIFDSPETHVMATRMRLAGRAVLGPTSDVVALMSTPATGQTQTLGWFDGNGLVGPLLSGRVYHKFIAGDIGPLTPCTGYSLHISDHPVTEFAPLIDRLKTSQYRGPVVFSDCGTAAPYWGPMIFAFAENLKGSLSVFLSGIAQGQAPLATMHSPCVAGIRLSVPPWPYELPSNPAPVIGISEPAMRHIWFEDLASKNEGLLTMGCSNTLGFVTARGQDPREAVRRAYRTVGNITVDGLQYRPDIGHHMPNKQEVSNGFSS